MATRPDAAAIVALEQEVVRPRWLAFLDFDGDPVRRTTWPVGITFGASATGDPLLDGFTYEAIDPRLVTVGEVAFTEAGSETLVISLSGLNIADADNYEAIADPANWQGRRAVLWQGVADEDYAQAGVWWKYYDGRMVDLTISGSADRQTIDLEVETYLAALSPPSNRTYLDQEYFDPDDHSAAATIGAANGSAKSRTGLPPGVGGGTSVSRRESMWVRNV